jgi:hypothetical protein
MKKQIIESNTEPNKNCLWLTPNGLKRYGKSGWEDLTNGSGGGGGQSNKNNVLEIEHGYYQDYQHYYVIINGTKLITENGMDDYWSFNISKEDFLRLLNVDDFDNLIMYNALKNIYVDVNDNSIRKKTGPIEFEITQRERIDGYIKIAGSYMNLIILNEDWETHEFSFNISRDA